MISLHDDLITAMSQEYRTENMVALAFAVLLQAVRDYVRLRELGIVSGREVREWRFYKKYNSDRSPNHPLNFATAEQVKVLIHFLDGKDLDYYCSLLGVPSCRIRSAIGLTKSVTVRHFLTLRQIDEIERSEAEDMKRELWLRGGVL